MEYFRFRPLQSQLCCNNPRTRVWKCPCNSKAWMPRSRLAGQRLCIFYLCLNRCRQTAFPKCWRNQFPSQSRAEGAPFLGCKLEPRVLSTEGLFWSPPSRLGGQVLWAKGGAGFLAPGWPLLSCPGPLAHLSQELHLQAQN